MSSKKYLAALAVASVLIGSCSRYIGEKTRDNKSKRSESQVIERYSSLDELLQKDEVARSYQLTAISKLKTHAKELFDGVISTNSGARLELENSIETLYEYAKQRIPEQTGEIAEIVRNDKVKRVAFYTAAMVDETIGEIIEREWQRREPQREQIIQGIYRYLIIKDMEDMKKMEDMEDMKKMADMKYIQDMQDMKDMKDMGDMRYMKKMEDMKDLKDMKDMKDMKDLKDMIYMKDLKDMKDMEDMRYMKDMKDLKDLKDMEDMRYIEDIKKMKAMNQTNKNYDVFKDEIITSLNNEKLEKLDSEVYSEIQKYFPSYLWTHKLFERHVMKPFIYDESWSQDRYINSHIQLPIYRSGLLKLKENAIKEFFRSETK